MFNEMKNMPNVDANGERFMRSEDVKKMAQEVGNSVVAQATTDYGYMKKDKGQTRNLNSFFSHRSA